MKENERKYCRAKAYGTLIWLNLKNKEYYGFSYVWNKSFAIWCGNDLPHWKWLYVCICVTKQKKKTFFCFYFIFHFLIVKIRKMTEQFFFSLTNNFLFISFYFSSASICFCLGIEKNVPSCLDFVLSLFVL